MGAQRTVCKNWVLSYHVVHRDWIQVTMLSRKCLYQLNHLANPKATFFKECVWVFCLHICLCTMWYQQRTSDLLVVELQMVGLP